MAQPKDPYLTARQAAAELQVSVTTLYAYVSRGLLRSEPTGPGERTRRYLREDVRRLRRRREQRRDPSKAVERALYWGEPVMESAMTLIRDGRVYYRGHDARELARERDLEEVAHLLWHGELPARGSSLFAAVKPVLPRGCFDLLRREPRLHPVETLQATLALAASEDLASYDLRPSRVVRCGARILGLMAAVGAESLAQAPDPRRLARSLDSRPGVAETLKRAWAPRHPQARSLINAILVLCADHEFNVSSFTARCVASANSTPYGVVTAGLATLRGTPHGGLSERVEAFLGEFSPGDPRGSIRRHLAGRLKRGEPVYGFGHPLYPHGDPRCQTLLELLRDTLPDAPFLSVALEVAEEVEGLLGERPTMDFALATLVRVLELRPGAALTLFALGRTVGWIGHALEQYEVGRLIRPRARYTGPLPEEGHPL